MTSYSQRNERIVSMALQRVPPIQIADQTGINIATVYQTIAKARQTGIDIAPFPTRRRARASEARSRTVTIQRGTLDALVPAAKRRNLSVNELVRKILATSVEDQMIDAILDDGE